MSRFRHPESELEAVLQEIAENPDARMLRGVAEALMGPGQEEPVRVSAPGLERAERHLLDMFREELGELLRQRCLIEFFAQPGADERWHRHVSIDRQLEVPEIRPWEARAGQAREIGLAKREDELVVLDLLDQCVTGPTGARSITELARASLRIAPRDSARVYVALDLQASGRYAESRRQLEAVLSDARSSLIRSYAWEALGVAASVGLDLEETRRCYTESSKADEQRTMPMFNLLLTVCLQGRTSDIQRYGKEIQARGEPDATTREYVVRKVREVRAKQAASLGGSWRAAIASARDRLGGFPREVLGGVL